MTTVHVTGVPPELVLVSDDLGVEGAEALM